MTDFYHHSRLLRCRTPQGAARMGQAVHISADTSLPAGTQYILRLWIEGEAESLYPMREDGGRVFADVPMPDRPCLVWYFFVLRLPDGHTLYYGGKSGAGTFCKHEPDAYQITVFDPAFSVPESFCEGVCYQIFPDRFKRSSWEDFRTRADAHIRRERHPVLHDRWSDAPLDRPGPGQKDYHPNDFFGGDLNGIRQKLPYLASLGVTWLYLNPIFESESNHRYNTADYHAIDPILGSEEDFAALCREAGEHGIRIMLDGVFSHTGSDSRYFNREGNYEGIGAYQGTASPYYEWYTFTDFPDGYACWWGFDTLPNVTEMTPSYVDFIAGENGVLAHWMRLGASGWRLDVADELPDAFIRILNRRVRELNPVNGVLLGEVWEDCSNKFAGAQRRDYVDGGVLDAAMNYPFSEAVVRFLTGRADAYQLNYDLALLREHYPEPFFRASLNLMSSHDNVRTETMLAGAPDRMALSREEQARYRPSERDARLGRLRMPLAASIQASFPGVPCIYYGDEAGMTGMSDPYNRYPYPWGDEDAQLVEAFRKLFTARRDCDALKRGCCRMGALDPDVFAIVRYLADNRQAAILLVNRSEAPHSVALVPDTLIEGPDGETPVALAGGYRDVLTGREYVFSENAVRLTIEPMQSILMIRG